MKRPYQNNELYEISNIIGKSHELIEQNEIDFILPHLSSNESNALYLESFNASLNNNLPIFERQEEEKKNNTNQDGLGPTEERELYFIENLQNLSISPRNPFVIFNKKKRGRVKQERNQEEINEKEDNDYIKIHDKNTSDNLLRKIQVHYLSFIVVFLNEILAFLNIKQRFLKLNYEFKSNIKKEFVNSLKAKTIGDIIRTQISIKYKQDLNYNNNIYVKTKGNKVLNKIYSENYLLFFRKIYFKSDKKINLREYGLNKEIKLSDKAKLYKDLIKNLDDVYKKNICNCVRNNFIDNLLFKTE